MKLAIAYFGSPDFSARFLEKLLTDEETKKLVKVKLVVTQPDKPVGRKQILTPTPVKLTAEKYKIKIKYKIPNPQAKPDHAPRDKFKTFMEFGAWYLEFDDLKGVDFALVYAYNQIIPKEYLELPKYGFWCIHPSLLPKYRGPSPIATALINGDKEAGVSIFKMNEKIDHGPIIAQERISIAPTDLRPDLEKKLTDLGFEMFKKIIIKLQTTTYNLQPKKQDHKLATYTKKLKKGDGFIEFDKLKNLMRPPTHSLQPTTYNLLTTTYNLFRGLYPWPGLWTILPNGKRLKITGLQLQPTTHNLQPTHYNLQPTKVQLEGKKEVDFTTFNRAYKVF
jgi:methionyl-tRNA formyltransferase